MLIGHVKIFFTLSCQMCLAIWGAKLLFCNWRKGNGGWGSVKVPSDSVGFMKPALIEGKVCRSFCKLLSPIVTRKNVLSLSVPLDGQYWHSKKPFSIHSVQIEEPQDTHKQVFTEGLKCLQAVFILCCRLRQNKIYLTIGHP